MNAVLIAVSLDRVRIAYNDFYVAYEQRLEGTVFIILNSVFANMVFTLLFIGAAVHTSLTVFVLYNAK